MGAKAVYNNQSVMIYITAEHARSLLANGALIMECYIGPHLISPVGCYVELSPEVITEYQKIRTMEVDAIQAVKDQLKASNPRAASNPSQRRERKRRSAHRTTSANVHD